MRNKTTKDLQKEALYLGIKGFSWMKKDELENAVRNVNTKGTQTDNEACERCLHEQYKQRLIDEHLYTKSSLTIHFESYLYFVITVAVIV